MWVVEAGDPSLGSWARLLPRLGRVVDVAGRSSGEVAAELRDLGVDGVLAFTDTQLLTAARLGEALGSDGNPVEVVRALTDKVVQREVLAAVGLPGPRHVAVDADAGPDGLAGLLAGLRFPVVVKPRRGSGSRDTVRFDDADGATRYLRRASVPAPAAT